MILTSALGAAAGFVLLWWVLLSCWIKSLIQAEFARYTLVSGDTYVRAMNRLPFRIRIGRGHLSFAVAIALVALVPGLLGMGGIIGGAGQALTLLVPGSAVDAGRRRAGRDRHCRPDHGLLPDPRERDARTGHGLHRRNARLRDLMQGTEFAVTRADLASGFTFSFPPEFVVAAMAVYGYTGVNSAETSAYQYWCVEKGYPSFIGRGDAPGWESRARGWIKVMQTDVWVTLVLLTCATVPFYMLGAGVLKKLGKAPDGLETISMLSGMFTQTLGPWSLWLFGVGAFCILFSTVLSFLGGEARYIPDYIMELGYLKRRNLAARRLWIRGYCTVVPIFCFIVYMWIQNPRLLITIGALSPGCCCRSRAAPYSGCRRSGWIPAFVRAGGFGPGSGRSSWSSCPWPDSSSATWSSSHFSIEEPSLNRGARSQTRELSLKQGANDVSTTFPHRRMSWRPDPAGRVRFPGRRRGEAGAESVRTIGESASFRGINGILFGPDGDLYLTSVVTPAVARIDPESGEILDNWGLETGRSRPTTSPSGPTARCTGPTSATATSPRGRRRARRAWSPRLAWASTRSPSRTTDGCSSPSASWTRTCSSWTRPVRRSLA